MEQFENNNYVSSDGQEEMDRISSGGKQHDLWMLIESIMVMIMSLLVLVSIFTSWSFEYENPYIGIAILLLSETCGVFAFRNVKIQRCSHDRIELEKAKSRSEVFVFLSWLMIFLSFIVLIIIQDYL